MRRGQRGKNIEPAFRSTGHPALDLFAGVIRKAIYDANRGDQDAEQWLADVCPSWRRYDLCKPRSRGRRRSR